MGTIPPNTFAAAGSAATVTPNRRAGDSSRMLLGLMSLGRTATPESLENDPLLGVIDREVLRCLLSTLNYRDQETVLHSRRVAQLATGIAEQLGWEGRHLKTLEVAALMHDIGKIGVPDNILHKPAKLSPEEAELMGLHHCISIDVLQACRADKDVTDVVAESFRHFDGISDGMKGGKSNTQLGARILGVADAYDSLRSDKPYRKGRGHEETLAILSDSAGTQFDASIIAVLDRWFREEGEEYRTTLGNVSNALTSSGAAGDGETAEAQRISSIFSYLYLLENLYDGFYLVDANMRFVVWNRRAETLFSRPARELIGQTWSKNILGYVTNQGDELAETESPVAQVLADGIGRSTTLAIRRKDGSLIDVEVQTMPLFDEHGELQGVAEIHRDLSRACRRPQEFRELKLAASRDALTSVANRGELETQLAQFVCKVAADPENEELSVIFLDVDHFKSVNDTYGHAVGDQVLVDMSRLLTNETYSGELVGRYGGEEFVILCPSTDGEQAVRRAERLRQVLGRTRLGGAEALKVTASFGVTTMEPGDSVDSLLRRADKALYRSKEGGRNRSTFLANQDLTERLDQADKSVEEDESGMPLRYEASFQAVVASEMIVFKLGGFVEDQRAKLIEVTPQRARMKVGHAGLLPFWGKYPEQQPVELIISYDAPKRSPHAWNGRRGQTMIQVEVRPRGWVRNTKTFESRARAVVKQLRSYFIAE